MELRWFRVESELKAVLAFMEWQWKQPLVTETPTVLRVTNGHPDVLLYVDGEFKARGFFGIIEYLGTAGLLQC